MEVVTSNREVREGFQKVAAFEAFEFASMAVQAERLDLFSELRELITGTVGPVVELSSPESHSSDL